LYALRAFTSGFRGSSSDKDTSISGTLICVLMLFGGILGPFSPASSMDLTVVGGFSLTSVALTLITGAFFAESKCGV